MLVLNLLEGDIKGHIHCIGSVLFNGFNLCLNVLRDCLCTLDKLVMNDTTLLQYNDM